MLLPSSRRNFFSSTQTILSQPDPICELASNIRYGPSSTSEIGYDLAYMKANRILLFVDPHIRNMDPFAIVMESIEQHCKAQVDVYLSQTIPVFNTPLNI